MRWRASASNHWGPPFLRRLETWDAYGRHKTGALSRLNGMATPLFRLTSTCMLFVLLDHIAHKGLALSAAVLFIAQVFYWICLKIKQDGARHLTCKRSTTDSCYACDARKNNRKMTLACFPPSLVGTWKGGGGEGAVGGREVYFYCDILDC